MNSVSGSIVFDAMVRKNNASSDNCSDLMSPHDWSGNGSGEAKVDCL